MFHIYLSGHIKNKKQVENFCDKVLHHFFKNRIKRDIDIDIRITKSLSDGTAGGCYGDHESIVIEIAKGVQVPNQRYMLYDYKEVIVTLAHELVHAKQFIKGELHPSLNKWKRLDYSNVAYSRTPWEKEAYLLEDKLLETHWK